MNLTSRFGHWNVARLILVKCLWGSSIGSFLQRGQIRVFKPALSLLLGILALGSGAFGSIQASEGAPETSAITSIHAVGEHLIVIVSVPAGKRRVTLESRPRLIRGAWTPRDVIWSEANEAVELTFTLPLGEGMEMLRVLDQRDFEVGLPANFFAGLRVFAPVVQAEGLVLGNNRGGLPVFNLDATGGPPSTSLPETAPRTVVESDIWKLEGHTVYFFNQQTGLQVIDLGDPDRPVVTGSLPLAVWGEQMYRLPAATGDGSVWLALLAQSACGGTGSEVLLVNVKEGRPMLTRSLPIRGQIKETRLVGDVLYLATDDWVQRPLVAESQPGDVLPGLEVVSWENRTLISALDLASPANPVAQPVVELPVTPDAIAATDRFLFVATTGSRTPLPFERLPEWSVLGNHGVILFDLSDPQGVVTQKGFLRTTGRVTDKFKLGTIGADGNALAVVSQVDGNGRLIVDPRDPNGALMTWEWIPPRTVIETFSLGNLTTSAPLGQLTLVTNEMLFGTRFSGDRAYVVTFRVVDPLWIMDLTDLMNPTVEGELQIPGYSTYLQPLADNTRLLTLGVEGSRTTVQLFDVANPAKASLLSKVFLGQGWSWSEGNSDEKAFQVFPDARLALVPWQGQRAGDQPGQWFQGVQLIDVDLGVGTLTARGVIDHALQARRATLLDDRIISVSARELLSVDATDRDHPRTVAELALSTQVDRVFLSGEQLVEVRYPGDLPAQVALATVTDPEKPLAVLSLDAWPILGADLRAGRLVLLQSRADEGRSESLTVSNAIIKSVPQQPLKVARTEYVLQEFPPPLVSVQVTHVLIYEEDGQEPTTNVVVQVRDVPQPRATNIVSTRMLKSHGPSPLDPLPSSYWLTWIRPEFTPQPSTWKTNEVVVWDEIPQPSLLVTNWVSEITWQNVRVPGETRLSVIEVGIGTLRLVSQVTLENPTEFYGIPLIALWPKDDQVVWTEATTWFGAYDLGFIRPLVGSPGAFTSKTEPIVLRTDMALPMIGPGFWWGPWWGQETRHYLAFDLAEPAAPKFASHTQLGGTNDWNGFSESFVADGKVFVSHRVSTYIPVPPTNAPVTGATGGALQLPLWQPGVWEHHSFLDVLDFSDLANPVVRAPVEFPETLRGTSHKGSLVYAARADRTEPSAGTGKSLHALAYDGVKASLVASLALPELWPQPLVVSPEGRVVLGRAFTNAAPTLESWSINLAGEFARYASVSFAVPAEEVHTFGDLLVVSGGEEYRLFTLADPDTLVALGRADRPCGLGFEWRHVAASSVTGLWIPRGGPGLWHAPLRP